MSEEHQIAAPELEAPSLGQTPPTKPTVHHLVANDLEIDLATLFSKLSELARKPPPPFLRPLQPDKE